MMKKKKATKKPRVKLSVQVLQRARALIKKGWTRRSFAKDKRDNVVWVNDPTATKFCLAGALDRATRDLGREKRKDPHQNAGSAAYARVLDVVSGKHCRLIASFNDDMTTTKQDVIAVIDAAINMETN